jgi:hypothetical protein
MTPIETILQEMEGLLRCDACQGKCLIDEKPCDGCACTGFFIPEFSTLLPRLRAALASQPVTMTEEEVEAMGPDRNYYPGCGDNSCLVFKPQGMGTNGGCRCYSDPRKASKAIQILWNRMQFLARHIQGKEGVKP